MLSCESSGSSYHFGVLVAGVVPEALVPDGKDVGEVKVSNPLLKKVFEFGCGNWDLVLCKEAS